MPGIPTDSIVVRGASEHNLRGVDVEIPRGTLTTITGVSGSGKSSLAFDTLYREGQRRFLESLSSYARQFLGQLEKPRVESVEGLSPTVALDPRRAGGGSRSTVGTVTEIHDFLRLLYARLGRPHCPRCARPVTSQGPDEITEAILREGGDRGAVILAPIVRDRKGEYRKEIEDLRLRGYVRARIDGEVRRLEEVGPLERQRRHTIEVLIDRIRLGPDRRGRLAEAVELALREGNGVVGVILDDDEVRLFGSTLACPDCGVTLPELEPRLFSFNSPHGACPTCQGLGEFDRIDPRRVVPDASLSIAAGALAPLGPELRIPYIGFDRADLRALARAHGFSLETPFRELTSTQRKVVLEGGNGGGARFEGVVRLLDRVYRATHHPRLRPFAESGTCADCGGTRLRDVSRHVRFRGRTLPETAALSIDAALRAIREIRLERAEVPVGRPILRELTHRLEFLRDVGLGYLTLDRRAATLAGGEAQRIRLARQIGTGLRGVLYVLDEPSAGLHARDNRRLLDTLHGLRDLGNTVVVVEHDAATILESDHVVDLGPGAGRDGGRVVASGPPAEILRSRRSLTGAYLRGERATSSPRDPRSPTGGFLEVLGARQHNLQGIDVAFPIGLLVAVTGVSGSGKSTLVDLVVKRAVARALGVAGEAPGAHDAVRGHEAFDRIVEVDASPIGRTARSNAATYTGLFGEIRRAFAVCPEARMRGWTPARFSFNVAGGRCEACGGAGVREIEMQFLANVSVPCDACGGDRFNAETLAVRYKGRNIREVLELTVDDALAFFENLPRARRILETLRDVGLGYLPLGQPSTTVSGGEAQRVKLAAELARREEGRTLYLLDEPTTGLHFEDIRRLLASLDRLVNRGNTVIVVEHNLDVIRAADWIVDLGPEGGEAGGRVVAAGPPEAIARCRASHTGAALRARLETAPKSIEPAARGRGRGDAADRIRIEGARAHNLRGISVEVPANRLTVITGVSGAGKSSLAFDTLFAEGQRRFLESLSTYARRFLGRLEGAPVDRIDGLRPAIAIEARVPSRNPRSTVGTTTEIHDLLRLLFARAGTRHCPRCGRLLQAESPSAAARRLLREAEGEPVQVLAPVFLPGFPIPLALDRPEHLPAFAEELRRQGFLRVRIGETEWRLGRGALPVPPPDCAVHLVVDRLAIRPASAGRFAESLEQAYAAGHGIAALVRPAGIEVLASRPVCVPCGFVGEREVAPRSLSFNSRSGACPRCDGLGRAEGGRDADGRACPECGGARLKAESLAIRVGGLNLAEVCAFTVEEAVAFFARLELDAAGRKIAAQLLDEIRDRLTFLERVGLGYLTLDRRSMTLAGGEAQRIRLATQIGNRLVGVLYVLDEPTIGLHPRDTEALLATLLELRDRGNTVVVVEHDPAFLARADHVIDLGPEAGPRGGELLYAGDVAGLAAAPRSLTGAYLAGRLGMPGGGPRRAPGDRAIRIRGARVHNLQGIDVEFPLGLFHVVTGVSGSGKSSLVFDVLHPNLQARLDSPRSRPRRCDRIEVPAGLRRIVVSDGRPVGRTPASTPATYCGAFDGIRDLFAEMRYARLKGYGKGRFSTRAAGGRCEACKGLGALRIEMHFLSDVWVTCEACKGRRFNEETLRVEFRGKNLAEVLALGAAEALALFESFPRIAGPLRALVDVGLGYLTLGQPATTISAGESQRLRLARALARSGGEETIFLLDEPTTGLHFADVRQLLEVFRGLVDAGHTLVVVEHHGDVVRAADRVLDLGPGAGARGGRVVAVGPPETVMEVEGSETGRFLRGGRG